MALIKCPECGREVSDMAVSCPNCGLPISNLNKEVPTKVVYKGNNNFHGSLEQIVKIAIRAVQQLGWTIDSVDSKIGILNFQTKISWGSWSGISATLVFEEVEEFLYKVSGTAKQNVRGGQIAAFNLGREAESKVKKAIETMKSLSSRQ